MARLPPPPSPDALAAILPRWEILPPGTEIWRIYRTTGDHPQQWREFRTWGPHHEARFDHHLPPPREQDRGILYGARAITTCVAEAFQRTGVVARRENDPDLVCFKVTDVLWLLDLRGIWPTIAGASMALNSALDRERTQAWSRAIYAAYPNAHGLWYASSMHANEPAVALFERAMPLLASLPEFNLPLADPSLNLTLVTASHAVGYAIV